MGTNVHLLILDMFSMVKKDFVMNFDIVSKLLANYKVLAMNFDINFDIVSKLMIVLSMNKV